MSDLYFNDYKKNGKRAKQDTGKIPLTEIERRRQAEINRRRYEEIVRKQQQDRINDRQSNYNGYDPRYYPRQQYQTYQDEAYQLYDEPGYAPPVNQPVTPAVKKKKKRKGCGCSSAFTSLFLIAAILFVGCFGYVFLMCCKTDFKPTRFSNSSYDVMSNPQVYNVLLIGSDKASEDGSSRSDSMILVSVDSKNKQLKFTSFMRDMWVTIPGYGDAKLNAAYAYGGAPLLMNTIESTFKVKIDNYVTVNFDMFKSLIDALDGVEVDITEAEANFINNTTHAKVSAGTNTLDGDYALIYCRIRKLDSDFNRTQRQRKVMAAIVDKARQKPLSVITSADDVLEQITTDISPLKMTFKAFSSPKYLTYGNDQLRIPIDGEYADRMIEGQAALVIDFNENIKAVQKFIYGETNIN